jgi:anti-sigma regulatory factor (Ser/Thr protein kinase)
MREVVRIPVAEQSQAAEARRAAVDLAGQAGFDEVRTGEIAIAVTEAGNNLAKHTPGGEILVSIYTLAGRKRIEVLAIDRGPGMNKEECLIDGFSTKGTQGTGLGAIARLSTNFDAYSSEKGTVVFAGFTSERTPPRSNDGVLLGSARAPKSGETKCGDDWTAVRQGESVALLVADGLGHGYFAAEAAAEAVNTFETNSFASASDAVKVIHGALRGTRGAAIAVAELGSRAGVSYCGLGNIAGALLSASSVQHMVSMNGTAGHDAHRITEFQYAWPEGGTLVMHSDGLMSRWSLDQYPGLLNRHPSVIAAVLYRDYTRGRDDTTVVVAKRA